MHDGYTNDIYMLSNGKSHAKSHRSMGTAIFWKPCTSTPKDIPWRLLGFILISARGVPWDAPWESKKTARHCCHVATRRPFIPSLCWLFVTLGA